jgi:hypothetical protein
MSDPLGSIDAILMARRGGNDKISQSPIYGDDIGGYVFYVVWCKDNIIP